MLFPVFQNEKEGSKKENVTVHQAPEISELCVYDLPLARIFNFFPFLLCEIQLRICQTKKKKKIEYLFCSSIENAFYISLGKIVSWGNPEEMATEKMWVTKKT